MKKISYFIRLCEIWLCEAVGCILKLNKRNRDIWLIGERSNEAKDNGYHLFKYIRCNQEKQKIFYVIDKKSSDVEKLKTLGNIVYHNSFKHYLYFVMCTKLICAHQGSCVPSSPVAWKLQEGLLHKKRIYIKHGIIKEKIMSHMYENTQFDIIVCGAKPEYDFIKAELGYPEENVKYLGLCRFDNLHDNIVKNQILVMPTWRSWFGSTWGGDDYEEFLKSDYYLKFKSLINNKAILEYLNDYNMELIFYPHYEMQKYLKYFTSRSAKVKIADSENYDVQQLLKESKILITDYSSIAFDFAYMRKPVIYYQFDQGEYYSKHYNKGYFDYERDGFGVVAIAEEQIINAIAYIIENKKDKKYIVRATEFFPLYDKENCRRHFNEIIDI